MSFSCINTHLPFELLGAEEVQLDRDAVVGEDLIGLPDLSINYAVYVNGQIVEVLQSHLVDEFPVGWCVIHHS